MQKLIIVKRKNFSTFHFILVNSMLYNWKIESYFLTAMQSLSGRCIMRTIALTWYSKPQYVRVCPN